MAWSENQSELYEQFVGSGATPLQVVQLGVGAIEEQIMGPVEQCDDLDQAWEIADPIWQEAIRLVAQHIHGEWCGCDDKWCGYEGEIADWLAQGSYDGTETLESLLNEWSELNESND